MVKKGIPKKVLEEIDPNIREEIDPLYEATAIVERHQIKFPVPGKIRRELDLKKGQKLKVRYDRKNRSVTYSF